MKAYQCWTLPYNSTLVCTCDNNVNNVNLFREYRENIEVIDRGVKETEELITEFFNDNKTAFVYTSDHGMTDWGKSSL